MEGKTDMQTAALTETEIQALTMDYPELFQSSEPIEDRITKAANRLARGMGKPLPPEQLLMWVQRLRQFSPADLTRGFIAAESTLDAWPAVSKVIRLISEIQFPEDYAWILKHLKIHRKEWRDRRPVYDPIPRRIPGGTPDDLYPPVMLEPGIPAPPIPERVRAAVLLLGNGVFENGLAYLERHPDLERYEWDASESMRYRKQIDDGFKAAWMTARLG